MEVTKTTQRKCWPEYQSTRLNPSQRETFKISGWLVNFFQNIVSAANAVNSNVWAFLAMLIGVFLSVHKIPLGDQMIMASFALLRSAGTTMDHTNVATVKVGS